MKSLIFASSFLLMSIVGSTIPASSQGTKMHKATVEVGMKKTKNASYYVVKMNGKMYGMVPLSQLEKIYAVIDGMHMRW